jgi:hypothetical protein
MSLRPDPPPFSSPATAVFAACVLHGIAGETAPAEIGIVEVAIAVCLVLASDPHRLVRLVDGRMIADRAEPAHVRCAVSVLHLIVWVPLLNGIVNGSALGDIVRDLVPVAFPALALVLPPPTGRRDPVTRALTAGLATAGTLIAVRWIAGPFGPVSVGAPTPPAWARDLLLNDPSVVFAAAVLPLVGIRRGGAGMMVALVGGVTAFGALLFVGHRAGVVAATIVIVFGIRETGAAGRVLPIVLLVCAAGMTGLGAPVVDAVGSLTAKFADLGLNARPEEAAAAIVWAADGPLGVLLGRGWGARFPNPAAGGDVVRYVHGLGPYLVLKTGVIGTMAVMVWAVMLFPVLRRAGRADPIVALATLPALVIGTTVHTSYKFLAFGLVLALLTRIGTPELER